jgi:hypothetical protein
LWLVSDYWRLKGLASDGDEERPEYQRVQEKKSKPVSVAQESRHRWGTVAS